METFVFRERGERSLPADLALRVAKPRGRPRVEYMFRVKSPEDVERLRRLGFPCALLTSEWVSSNGYPQRFGPLLFTAQETVDNLAESVFPVIPVKDKEALTEPRFEEFVTFLLKVDTLAARAVLRRNSGKYNPSELYRRFRNEGLERLATKVNLQEFVPALPRVGESLSTADLDWVESNNPPTQLSQ